MNEPDESGNPPDGLMEHRVEHSFEVTASPEEVWEAIATESGIATWMVPARIDPRVGGQVWFDFGDFESTGVITDHTPNERFAYEEPWPITMEGPMHSSMVEWFDSLGVPLGQVRDDVAAASPIATEFIIESRSGGSCVVRVVTSSFGRGSDWENEFFAEMAAGWMEMLDRLTHHLDHSAPRNG